MARERGQKKSFEQSLEDIKERMKEKRSKRLNSAVATKGRSKNVNKTSGGNVRRVILKGVQLNNKALAVALQAEKEKVRQANGVILQLKKEQQALFLHLLLLRRRLKENEVLSNVAQAVSQKIPNETPNGVVVSKVMQASPIMDEPLMRASPETSSDLQPLDDAGHCKVGAQFNLPRTVGVRRRRAESRRSRSECRGRRRHSFSLGDNGALPESHIGGDLKERKALAESPIPGDEMYQNQTQQDALQEATSPIGLEEFQHSTPDSTPAKPTSPQPPPPRRRGQAQEPRPKADPPARKPERGRKQDRVPLKVPWETSKPRARSKNRDHSAVRAKTAPAPQGDKLNTSLGFNDTFDFDYEGAVHLTPFRTKAEEAPPAAPIQEEAPEKPHALTGSLQETESSSSSESEGSPYIPQKIRKRLSPPAKFQSPPARRGRAPRAKVIPTQTRKSQGVSREEGLRPTAATSIIPGNQELRPPLSPDCVFAGSCSQITKQEHEQSEPQREEKLEDSLPLVTPGIEAEMMRIDNVLCGFGNTPSKTPCQPGHSAPIAKACRRGGLSIRAKGRGFSLCDVTNMSPAAYRKFSSTSSCPSDAQCSTPGPARKRRSTTAVDYKEPSLHAKLRRGDKFTDTKFLRSPIFKQKHRASLQNQSSLGKYDSSFVGCRY